MSLHFGSVKCLITKPPRFSNVPSQIYFKMGNLKILPNIHFWFFQTECRQKTVSFQMVGLITGLF